MCLEILTDRTIKVGIDPKSRPQFSHLELSKYFSNCITTDRYSQTLKKEKWRVGNKNLTSISVDIKKWILAAVFCHKSLENDDFKINILNSQL